MNEFENFCPHNYLIGVDICGHCEKEKELLEELRKHRAMFGRAKELAKYLTTILENFNIDKNFRTDIENELKEFYSILE